MVNQTLLSRRKFIQLLAVAVSSYPISSLAERRNKTNSSLPNKEPWVTLAEVQEHLFPSEPNSLGAKDINALVYLQNTINTPDFPEEEKTLIFNGVSWLEDLAKEQYTKKFIQLDNKQKEKILRRIENSNAGSRWLSLILTYLLQALLTDPIYGGNPNGVGWRWLEHQPGFPRPVENKKYFKLKQKRFRITKA